MTGIAFSHIVNIYSTGSEYNNHKKANQKYIKAKNKLKDLYRKQADIREQDHNILTNEILKNGNIIYVEEMNFKALQSRSKKTEKNDKGKFKKKKRFGKSLANKSPSKFLTILQNKLKAKGGLYFDFFGK